MEKTYLDVTKTKEIGEMIEDCTLKLSKVSPTEIGLTLEITAVLCNLSFLLQIEHSEERFNHFLNYAKDCYNNLIDKY